MESARITELFYQWFSIKGLSIECFSNFNAGFDKNLKSSFAERVSTYSILFISNSAILRYNYFYFEVTYSYINGTYDSEIGFNKVLIKSLIKIIAFDFFCLFKLNSGVYN